MRPGFNLGTDTRTVKQLRLGRGMQEQDKDILNHVFKEQGAVLDQNLEGISLGYLKTLPSTSKFGGLDQPLQQ